MSDISGRLPQNMPGHNPFLEDPLEMPAPRPALLGKPTMPGMPGMPGAPANQPETTTAKTFFSDTPSETQEQTQSQSSQQGEPEAAGQKAPGFTGAKFSVTSGQTLRERLSDSANPQQQATATNQKDQKEIREQKQRAESAFTSGRPDVIEKRLADQVRFSPEMQTQLRQLNKETIKLRHYRDELEKMFRSFLRSEPSPDDIKKASRFAASSIWDILKKSMEVEEDDEMASFLLALLMRVYNHEVFDHSERVMEWAVSLAEELGIEDEEELDNIGKAAFFKDIGMFGSAMGDQAVEAKRKLSKFLYYSKDALRNCSSLHDIGKMRIPENIINKAGPLDDEEFEIIKRHPTIGVEIVKPYPALHAAIPGIKYHHEKFDGSGYPEGLEGKAIPVIARIITITDTFDAMTEDRPYRKAMSSADAVSELLRLSGKQFDPDLVIPFLRMLMKKEYIDIEDIGSDTSIDLSKIFKKESPANQQSKNHKDEIKTKA